MNKDEKLIQLLQDTVKTAVEKQQKPVSKPFIPTYQIIVLTISALILGPMTILYNLDNRALRSQITELKTNTNEQQLLPSTPRFNFAEYQIIGATTRVNQSIGELPPFDCQGLYNDVDGFEICSFGI